MTAYVLYQLEWILRLFVAAICGGLVGYERKVRLKTAGIRTHMLVAVGSALFMIISKYGFFDVINHADVSLDPSRIASQVVTGIGFIGAGFIGLETIKSASQQIAPVKRTHSVEVNSYFNPKTKPMTSIIMI